MMPEPESFDLTVTAMSRGIPIDPTTTKPYYDAFEANFMVRHADDQGFKLLKGKDGSRELQTTDGKLQVTGTSTTVSRIVVDGTELQLTEPVIKVVGLACLHHSGHSFMPALAKAAGTSFGGLDDFMKRCAAVTVTPGSAPVQPRVAPAASLQTRP